jgi:hypothetical protein
LLHLALKLAPELSVLHLVQAAQDKVWDSHWLQVLLLQFLKESVLVFELLDSVLILQACLKPWVQVVENDISVPDRPENLR